MNDPSGTRSRPSYYLSADGRVAFPEQRSVVGRVVRTVLILSCVGAVLAAAAVIVFVAEAGRTPREWAPRLQQQTEGYRPLIVNATKLVATWLESADRLPRGDATPLPATLGASESRSGPVPPGRLQIVASVRDLRAAVSSAQPGDVIQLQAAHYRVDGPVIGAMQAGTAEAPITVRAAKLGEVVIDSDTVETFKVFAPFWRFENLIMRGVCGDQNYCEHAFHVVGGATDIIIRNNR